jgi:hypothetical protein
VREVENDIITFLVVICGFCGFVGLIVTIRLAHRRQLELLKAELEIQTKLIEKLSSGIRYKPLAVAMVRIEGAREDIYPVVEAVSFPWPAFRAANAVLTGTPHPVQCTALATRCSSVLIACH